MTHTLFSLLRGSGQRTWMRMILAAILLTGAFSFTPSAHASETISAILGTVYYDSTNSGAFGTGNTPAAGVTLMLTDANGAAVLDANGVPVPPAVTNVRGRYAFFNILTDRTYRVVETPPVGYAPELAAGPAANVTKESNTALVVTTPTPTGVSMNFDSNNFLLVQPVQVAGYVYIDGNSDHLIGTGDTLLSNPQVVLQGDFNGDGVQDTAQAVVDVTGHYTFTSWTNPQSGLTQAIPPGTYTIVQTVPSGYTAVDAFPGRSGDVKTSATIIQVAATTPNTLYDNENFLISHSGVTINGNGGGTPDNFAIKGFLWYDINGDALRAAVNPVDPGLGGVNVVLTGVDRNGVSVTLTTTTVADGSYTFQNLTGGNYTVTVDRTTLPAGLATETFDGINIVPDGLLDSQVNVLLNTATSPVTNVNFGYTGTGSIGDTVWNDANGNGLLDGGEKGISGVSISLVWAGPDGVFGTADDVVYPALLTDSNGVYNFTHLPAGNYKVSVDASSPTLGSFVQTYDLDGLDTPNCAIVNNLAVGQSRLDADFGYWQPASLSGITYCDTNNNGLLDTAEGKAGVQVVLKDANGTIVSTTTSGAGGVYSFTNLVPGAYTVVTASTAGASVIASTNPLVVSLAAGQSSTSNNFRYTNIGSLSGTLYVDANKNLTLDSGEAKLGGITVTLKDGSGAVVGTTVTATDGTYSFANLVAGTYSVCAPATANGYSVETPSPLSVAVVAGQNTPNKNFGYAGNGSIGDTVWNDVNGNGIQDAGEKGIAGVTVNLVWAGPDGVIGTADDVVYPAMLTDTNGHYTFPNLPAGNYKVSVAPASASLASFVQTYDLDGLASANSAVVANLTVGQSRTDADFGYWTPASITGTVYCDKNNNSIADAGEGLAGVIVTLKNAGGGVVATATTDANGNYTFGSLPAGNYTVVAPTAAGGCTVVSTNPIAICLAYGQISSGNKFRYRPTCQITGKITCADDSSPLAGVVVTLKDSTGNTLATATTDGNGNYTFSSLAAGSYTVAVPLTSNGLTISGSNSVCLNLTAGSCLTQNFAYKGGAISGYVFCDADGSGTKGSSDAGISGVTVTLRDCNGITKTLCTDSKGFYCFSGCLKAGTYTVSVPSTINGKHLTTSNCQTVVICAGQTVSNINFGVECNNACISGTVYIDNNGNGKQDRCDYGIQSVTVKLINSSHAVIATACTDCNGKYSFKNLPAGTYWVQVPRTVSGCLSVYSYSDTTIAKAGCCTTKDFRYYWNCGCGGGGGGGDDGGEGGDD